MPRPKTYNTEGVVLKHMRLGEADRIITLYTPDRGKVRAVVKGARRAKSRKGGFLQPLTHVRVSIAEGRTLDQVVEAATVASCHQLKVDGVGQAMEKTTVGSKVEISGGTYPRNAVQSLTGMQPGTPTGS